MLISTRGRYALRVMIDLAEHRNGTYIPLKEVAERQEISEKYLESIIKVLVRAGLLEGARGKGGGYLLTRAPEDYTVGEILRLMEGELTPVACLGETAKPCTRSPECRTLPMWQELYDMINAFFDNRTVADLMEHGNSGGDYVV